MKDKIDVVFRSDMGSGNRPEIKPKKEKNDPDVVVQVCESENER